MIQSGEKKEEYREIKPYWIVRLTNQKVNCLSHSHLWEFKKYDAIEFINGYNPNSPRFLIECKGIELGEGNSNWGADPLKHYFKIKVGNIL